MVHSKLLVVEKWNSGRDGMFHVVGGIGRCRDEWWKNRRSRRCMGI